MDVLKQSALAFKKLTGSNYIITAQKKEQTINITIFFDTDQFVHLIGLNKLRDIPVLNNLNKRNIFQSILNDEINFETISKSNFIESIRERINYFTQLEALLNNEIILKFNRNKAHSTINATMLLYQKQDDVYLHLFLASKGAHSDIMIPCSFFPNKENKYILHQEIYKVVDIQKVDRHPLPQSLSEQIAVAQRKAGREIT